MANATVNTVLPVKKDEASSAGSGKSEKIPQSQTGLKSMIGRERFESLSLMAFNPSKAKPPAKRTSLLAK